MRVCPQCGVEAPGQAKFCTNCGYILSPVAVEQPARQPGYPPRSPASPFVQPRLNQGGPAYPLPQAVPSLPSLPYNSAPKLISPGKRNMRRLAFLWLAIAVVIVMALAGLFVFLSASKLPRLSILQGEPRPGQQLTLLGEHFPAGSRISLVVDTQPLLLSLAGANLQAALVPISFSAQQGIIYRAVVAGDGTFTVNIRIPALWKTGSKFIVVAQITSANPQQVKPVEYQITIL